MYAFQAIAHDEEIRQMEEIESYLATSRADMSRVPSGAMPMQDGVLSPRAAEFWFPESRDCACCSGYKHGCACCMGATKSCRQCGGAVSAPAAPPAPVSVTASAPTSTAATDAPPPPPNVSGTITIEAPVDDEPTVPSPTPAPSAKSGGVPVGVPSQGGKLSRHAAEFWFPECRDCSCCQGYKHGCSCCRGGVTVCSCAAEGTPGTTSSAPLPPAAVGGLVIEAPDDEPDEAPVSYTSSRPMAQGRGGGRGGGVPVGVPSQGGKLSRHAAEFWFPECRDCSCCQGYKHGCSCCKGPVVVCKCVGGTEAASYSPSHAPSRKPCAYFASGNCRYGNACNNLH